MVRTKSDTPAAEDRALSLADVAGMAVLCTILLLYSYLRGRHTIYWSDEIMGVLVLKQSTWAAVLHAWRDGIDSSGIWFEALGRLWTAAFGFSELSLRFFSAVGICASACVLWVTGRRFYSVLPVAASVTITYTTSVAMTWQFVNGRTYGVFLTACALVLWLLFRGEDSDAQKPSARFLLLTAFAYSFLMGSHILGSLYAGGFLGIQALLDWRAKRWRPSTYAAAAVSSIVLLYSFINIHATTALGKPSFWTVPPGVTLLLTFDHRTAGAIAVALLIVGFSLRGNPRRTVVYRVLVGFAAFDLLIWIYSHIGTSIYVDRYLLPFCLAAFLILCELLTQLREVPLPHPTLRRYFPVLFFPVVLAALFIPRLQRPWLPQHDYTRVVMDNIPNDLPLVCPDAGTFVELEYYHLPQQTRLLYPLDWPLALSKENHFGVSGMREMENFKAENLYADDILPTSAILNGAGDFAVIALPTNLWLTKHILKDKRFMVTQFETDQAEAESISFPGPVWRVHRR